MTLQNYVLAGALALFCGLLIFIPILWMDHQRCMEKRKAMFMENLKREVPVEAYWLPLWTFYVPNRFLPTEFRYVEGK